MNGMKMTILLGRLGAILIVGGRAIAGEEGLRYGLILAVGMNFFSYFFPEKIASASPYQINVDIFGLRHNQ